MLTTFLRDFVIVVCAGVLTALVANPLDWNRKRRIWIGLITIVVALLASYLSYHFKEISPAAATILSPSVDPNTPIEIIGPYTSKTIRLTQGSYQDFRWKVSVIRIEFIGIIHTSIANNTHYQPEVVDQATLHISNGGGIVYGGEQTTRVTVNEYSLPTQIPSEDEPRSMYYFYSDGNRVEFFRAVVDHINPTAKEVTLNLVFAEAPH